MSEPVETRSLTPEVWKTDAEKARFLERQARLEAWRAQVAAEKATAETSTSAPALELPKQYDPDDLSKLGIDWSKWTDEGCEEWLLAIVYNKRHSGNRRNPGEKLSEMNEVGIPDSEAKLAPAAIQQGQSGALGALQATLFPLKIAASSVWRDADGSSWTGAPWACPACGLGIQERVIAPDAPRRCECGTFAPPRGTTHTFGAGNVDLWHIKEIAGEDEWRPEERTVVNELTFRFKKLFAKWIEKGWLIPEPALKFNAADSSGVGRDGMPEHCRLTYRALDAAEERIRGTPLAKAPRSRLETASPEYREKVRVLAPWYFSEWKKGAKSGT